MWNWGHACHGVTHILLSHILFLTDFLFLNLATLKLQQKTYFKTRFLRSAGKKLQYITKVKTMSVSVIKVQSDLMQNADGFFLRRLLTVFCLLTIRFFQPVRYQRKTHIYKYKDLLSKEQVNIYRNQEFNLQTLRLQIKPRCKLWNVGVAQESIHSFLNFMQQTSFWNKVKVGEDTECSG